jgi:DNA-binding NarL/FixJ family response regulator
MTYNATTATALLAALRLAGEHGGADAALRDAGIDLQATRACKGLSDELPGQDADADADTRAEAAEALALGFLAGRFANRVRSRTPGDPTSFVMDRDLLVRSAVGESILRLPWFDDGLFVGRQLPEIREMPSPVRELCVEHYTAALAGERGCFDFSSYGHTYSVDAVPVLGEDGDVQAVLAVAMPVGSRVAAARAYERIAERMETCATSAEQRAGLHRRAGRAEDATAELETARRARTSAERARVNARQLRARAGAHGSGHASLTPREIEVLDLASHGLTSSEIGDQLTVSTGTVKTHLENIYAKLGVGDRVAAVAVALRNDLID